MNTILPKFVDFNYKTSFYKGATLWPESVISMIAIILLASTFIILCIVTIMPYKPLKSKPTKWFLTGMLTLSAALLLLKIYATGENCSTSEQYNHSGFKIANTNLMALPYNISTNIPTTMALDKNYRKANYYVYVDLAETKPTGLKNKSYVVNEAAAATINSRNCDPAKTIICLGQMKNGRFIPNYKNTKIVHVFTEYQRYIKKHQLESKFKHHFNFEISHQYFDNNNDPVLVAIGDDNFTLHYKKGRVTHDPDIS